MARKEKSPDERYATSRITRMVLMAGLQAAVSRRLPEAEFAAAGLVVPLGW